MKYLFSATLALLLCGCSGISTCYQGETFPADSNTPVIAETAPDAGEWQMIGKAVVEGKEHNDREQLVQALLEKAAEVGAGLVVITDYQVVPARTNRIQAEDSYMIWANDGAAGDSWAPMERDFAGGYGSADLSRFGVPSRQAESGKSGINTSGVYNRIIYADFYRAK